MKSSYVFVLDLDDTCIDTHGTGELYPDVGGVLKLLHRKHRLVLLTKGSMRTQYGKLRKCDIEKFFCDIIVVDTIEEKLKALTSIKTQAVRTGARVVVVGDRIDVEIRYGNQLDLPTVRVRRQGGKYSAKVPRNEMEYPVHEACSLEELLKLFP